MHGPRPPDSPHLVRRRNLVRLSQARPGTASRSSRLSQIYHQRQGLGKPGALSERVRNHLSGARISGYSGIAHNQVITTLQRLRAAG